MSKNSTIKQKLSPIEEKLLNEIRYLGKSISIVDDYYLKLKRIPTRKGEFPELIVMDPTSGAIPREPSKQVQEKYPEWYEAWRQVVQPAGKFYKIYNRLKDELRPILKTNYDAFYNLEDLYWWHIHDGDGSNLLDKIQRIRNAIIELRDKKSRMFQTNSKNGKTKKMRGITKKRGRKPKNPKHDAFMKILDDILSDDKNDSLGGYVIKVKEQMEKQDLRKKKGELIYTDSTIKTYIQKHPEYKKIQKQKEKRKKV